MTTPAPESLTMRLEAQSASALIVRLIGEAGQPQEKLLERFASDLANRSETTLVFDLSQLTFISSVGLRTLMTVRHHKLAARHIVSLAAVTEPILSVLRRSKLDTQFPIYKTTQEALLGTIK